MLYEQIGKDYVTAMKARDQVKSSTLNFLRAALKNVIIDKRVETLNDEEVVSIIKKQIKQRQDSIAQYQSGGRPELADKELAELTILKTYLPNELSQEQIENIVKEAVKEVGATSLKDMKQVMAAVMAKTNGQADNRLVSEIVKKVLA